MKNSNLSLPKLSLPAINVDPARLLRAGVLLAPIVLLQVVRLTLGGGGPETSAAAPLFDGPSSDAPQAPRQQTRIVQLTPQQKAALDYLTLTRQDVTQWTTAASPFPAPPPKVIAAARPSTPVEPAPTIEQPTEPQGPQLPVIPAAIAQAQLSSLLRSSAGEFAVINGKPYRAGDQFIDGWKLIEIKVNDRAVLLEGPQGEIVELSAAQG